MKENDGCIPEDHEEIITQNGCQGEDSVTSKFGISVIDVRTSQKVSINSKS